ncbi:TonB-dependent receptor [Novosphingobium sp.]|uniref:TonB-dependent receptor n=1 Tax=Novosphingobium sp. TaxID=1874826 RepID=UPI0025F75A22|nr:TonB-dependent receptor [Novosphingobium sp.]
MIPILPAWTAEAAADAPREILVTGQKADAPPNATIDNPPATTVTIDAAKIATTVNAVSVEDALKYAPSLIIRKRSIGDNFAPIATRTSGLGGSARSLIYADGALLSALIGNNNGSASPKWNLVAPEEVASIDVLYGPFSAAYAGNSIGTVVNITTRMPDKLEAQATVLTNYQHHEQYNTVLDLPTGQASASIGNKFGPLSVLLTATHTVSNAQPIVYVTAASAPAATTGSIATFNRLGAAIRVLGAGDIDHHVEDTIKLKTAYDLTDGLRASYTLGLFLDSTRTRLDTVLRDAAGNPASTSGFNSGLYLRRQRHFSHAAALDGHSSAFDWKVIGTLYAYGKDSQASPTAALPGAFAGGAGTVQRQDGTGWWTLDAKAAWRSGDHVLSFGGHVDRYKLVTQTYATADWIGGVLGTRSAPLLGKTRTAALWVQDAWAFAPAFVLTLGARQEWWRAYGGFNQTTAANPGIAQPLRSADGFSPKATLEWRPAPAWSVKASFGQATRFPTVGELYQVTTVGTVLANPNPNLRPERARSGELALQYKDARGLVRLSLFDEVVKDALISQTGPLAVVQPNGSTLTATTSFVQNLDRTRARGVELAIDRRDFVPTVDFQGSVTYADAITSKDSVFPAAVGRLLPSVPHWKANAVLTWRPTPRVGLTAAARYSSRNFATLDNSDVFADTYQGFDTFFVVDLRATVKLTERIDAAIGIDNVNNNRYFLFHPFPQRSVTASLHWKL